MKIRCLIVDDEPVARKIIREFIERIRFMHLVAEAEDTDSAASILNEHKIDLIFLDIEMPKVTGIEYLKLNKDQLPLTVITTAYTEHAVDGFELDIIDYLVKPIAFDRFSKTCNKAKQYLQLVSKPNEIREYFFVKCNDRIEKINYDELIFAEAISNYVVLHTNTGQHITYLTLKGFLENVPSDKFIKVHKSFVVNTSKIKSIVGNEIFLDEKKVPLSQSMRSEVLQLIVGDRMIKR